MEMDLWDLETSSTPKNLPALEPRSKADKSPDNKETPGKDAPKPARTETDKDKPSPVSAPASSKLGSEFDDLDSLDSLEMEEEPVSPAPSPDSDPPDAGESPEAPEAAEEEMEDGDGEKPPETEPSAAAPGAAETGTLSLPGLLPKLSRLEKIGLGVLLGVLAIGSILVLTHWFSRLPSESAKVESSDFPIKGEKVTATSVETYWRAPVAEGPDADRFRRGTELLPVANLSFKGGPAAVRIFFRNGENQIVGDPITRAVSGDTSLKIAATAGFDDVGMHAAYRTGESRMWTLQVFEAPGVESPGSDFEPLFETFISGERR